MGVPVDPASLSEKHLAGLMDYINPLLNIQRQNQDQDAKREAVDKAIKQDFNNIAPGYYSSLQGQTQLNANQNIAEDERDRDAYDEFSSLNEPLLLKLYRSWVTLAKNSCFPKGTTWMGILRKSSIYFKKMGIQRFLPQANQAWENIINTENNRFGFKKKYSIGIAEAVAYGNTGCVHFYNPDGHYMDVTFPGIRNMGVYPSTNLWRYSNLIVQYDMQYSKMLRREDLKQEYVVEIVPSQDKLDEFSQNNPKGSTRRQQDRQDTVPFGHVRNFDVYIPSIYVPGDDGEEPFVGENLYVTLAYKPTLRDNTDLKLPESFQGNMILKIEKDVQEYDHGILFAAAGTTLPHVFFHQGMLIPFLPHQMLLNQQFSAMGRVTSYLEDPPLEIVRAPDTDFEQTPPEFLVAGAQYEGFNVRAIIPPEYYQVLDQFIKVNSYVSNSVESGSGLSKAQLAGITAGRTSASEVREAVSAGGANVGEFVDHIDEDLFTPSYILRIQGQQEQLRNQVEDALAETANPSSEDAIQEILEENPLFEKMLEFSNIEEMYEDFYASYRGQQVTNESIIAEIGSMMQRMQELQGFIQADTPPPVASPISIDPATGMLTPTQAEQDQAEEAYYAQAQQQKQQAIQELQMLQINIEKKQLEVKDLPDIPEPSLKLYYEVLSYPIKSSDIVATGAQTTMAKDFTRQFLKEWTGFIGALGPEGQSELDPAKLIEAFTRTTNFMLGDVTRDPEDKERMKAAAQAEAARLQQLQEMAASNPGSQIPKIGG